MSTTDGPYEEVPQRAGLALAGYRIATQDSYGDRQQQREDDTERGEREERAVTEDGGKERRTGTGSRTQIGNRQQYCDESWQRNQHADDQPGTRPADHLDQLDDDHARASASRTTCSRVRR